MQKLKLKRLKTKSLTEDQLKPWQSTSQPRKES